MTRDRCRLRGAMPVITALAVAMPGCLAPDSVPPASSDDMEFTLVKVATVGDDLVLVGHLTNVRDFAVYTSLPYVQAPDLFELHAFTPGLDELWGGYYLGVYHNPSLRDTWRPQEARDVLLNLSEFHFYNRTDLVEDPFSESGTYRLNAFVQGLDIESEWLRFDVDKPAAR